MFVIGETFIIIEIQEDIEQERVEANAILNYQLSWWEAAIHNFSTIFHTFKSNHSKVAHFKLSSEKNWFDK